LATVEELRRRSLAANLLWIGSESGIEREAAAGAGIPFQTIQTGKLRRYFSLQTVTDAARLPIGVAQARRFLASFRPDVVFSTGGFVSVPSVIAAKGIAPILTHEQTAVLGLATRIDARFADVLAVSWDQTAAAAAAIHRRVVVTGNPVRASLDQGDAGRARAAFGFSAHLPLLYVTGGARGASPLNTRLERLLPGLLERCQVLHQTGPGSANADLARLSERRLNWPSHLQDRYRPVEFVGDELPDVYAASDLILSRAGAGTVAELAVLGKPAILIPLPGAGGDEQTRNAKILADADGAVLIRQEQATPERLAEVVEALLADLERRRRIAANARSVAKSDAAARLADVLLELAGERPRERRIAH
jgi:UDP-N-acetylglucosamine--N-acetylmuramyl-(pentapeptide) pyrophosphoryl-undecaprenol N-acetylglucosamine transferase